MSLQFGSNSFYQERLNETRLRKSARRRSLPLATQQKSFLCVSDFARARFFLLKGKENFFAGFCSERAGRRAWPLFFARTRRKGGVGGIPPCSCGDGRDFWRRLNYLTNRLCVLDRFCIRIFPFATFSATCFALSRFGVGTSNSFFLLVWVFSRRTAFASDFDPLLLSTSRAIVGLTASSRRLPRICTSVFDPRRPRVFAFLCDDVSAIVEYLLN